MKLIILDRDGVINYESAEYIKSPAEWVAIPDSLPAIAELNRAGYIVVVATNQSGVGRGYYDTEMLARIHQKMADELAVFGGQIDAIFCCPHHPDNECECRKPKPGLLLQIQKKYQVALADIFFIGDSMRDIKTAQSAGCKPILVLTGNGQQALQNHAELAAIPHFANLAAAVKFILTS